MYVFTTLCVGCPVPVPPEGVLFHIDENTTEIAHDQELSYTCSRGFNSVFDDDLQTFPTIQCVGGIWEGETPSCEGRCIHLIVSNTCLTFCLNDTVIFTQHLICIAKIPQKKNKLLRHNYITYVY